MSIYTEESRRLALCLIKDRPMGMSLAEAGQVILDALGMPAQQAAHPAPAEGDEVLRLARVAVAESEGALMVCDWMEAALKVCRAVIAHPQPKGMPAGYKLLEDGKTMIPEDWTPLRLEWEPGYPEDVACGPVRAMERLKKWLDAYFVLIQQRSAPTVQVPPGYKLVAVKGFDEMVQAMDRAVDKGYMPAAMLDEWNAFDWASVAVGDAS